MAKLLLTAALALSVLLPCAGLSKENLPEVKVHRQGGVSYVSGGVDPLERKALKKMAERYQVQLTFAREGSSEPLTGVHVTLVDYKGDKAVDVVSDGPIFFANPPGGRWTIEAELDGETFSKTADIGSRFYVTFDFKFKSAKPN
jgi:hypothetical protein